MSTFSHDTRVVLLGFSLTFALISLLLVVGLFISYAARWSAAEAAPMRTDAVMEERRTKDERKFVPYAVI